MPIDRGYPWLKAYPTLLDDPKFMRLSDGARARYWELYLLAGKADAGGLIAIGDEVATISDLAFVLRRSEEEVTAQVDELLKASLLSQTEQGLVITRFVAEQGPSQAEKREEWRARQARKREKYSRVKDEVEAVETALDLDIEQEVEVTREPQVSHKSVTRDTRVTRPLPLPVGVVKASIHKSEPIRLWEEATGFTPNPEAVPFVERLFSNGQPPMEIRNRLAKCAEFWRTLAAEKGWAYRNCDAILELFAPGQLEDRAEKEGYVWSNTNDMFVLRTNIPIFGGAK